MKINKKIQNKYREIETKLLTILLLSQRQNRSKGKKKFSNSKIGLENLPFCK